MDDNTLLNNYFNGLLSQEDARAVEARVASDPDFEAEFSLRKEMEAFPRLATERDVFIASLKTISPEFFRGKTAETPALTVISRPLRRWIALAASITLIAASIWFFTQHSEPVYRDYAQHAPLALTTMGNADQAKSTAETAFKQQDYEGALTALNEVMLAEPSNIKAILYRGICLLELKRLVEARAVFEPMASGNSALRGEALWYLALSYLQEKDKAACKAALLKIESGNVHYKAAQKILKAL